jgi:hypothetical protein
MQLTMLTPQPAWAAGEPVGADVAASLGTALICTPDGPAALPSGVLPLPDASEPAPKAVATPCKWCQAFGNSVLPPSPAVSAILRPEVWQAAVFAEYDAGPVWNGVAIGFRSRAPPWIS